jgi:hypothetical protein
MAIRAYTSSRRTIHEIERGSNLDLLLRGFHGIGNRLVDALGGGLQAIALALSTPHDNSLQVQAQIDELTKTLRASSDKVEGAINQDKGD